MMSRYDCLNKKGFISRQKVYSELAATTSVGSGSVFQMRGAATAKARLPTVDSLMGGTTRRLALVELERSVRRPGKSSTRVSDSADRGNVVHRRVEPCTLEQPVCTEFVQEPAGRNQCRLMTASINDVVARPQAVDQSSGLEPPRSGPTGVDTSAKPEDRPARRYHSPAASAPVQSRASGVADGTERRI